ncbi:MAG: hypothetical protein ACRC6T_01820 [Sarcina sp.]
MSTLFAFYNYKNKKYTKTLFFLLCIFIVTTINTLAVNELVPKVLMSLASLCMIGAFFITFRSFWKEFKKSILVSKIK